MQIAHEGDSLKVNFTGGKFLKTPFSHFLPEPHMKCSSITFLIAMAPGIYLLGFLGALSIISLRNITAIIVTMQLLRYLAAVYYYWPFTDRPRNATPRMTATQMLYTRCKCAFLITHNELDLMTWASFEYWISHNRLQCPLMPQSLAHTVGDRAHVDLNNRWSKWGTDDALSLCRVLRSFFGRLGETSLNVKTGSTDVWRR